MSAVRALTSRNLLVKSRRRRLHGSYSLSRALATPSNAPPRLADPPGGGSPNAQTSIAERTFKRFWKTAGLVTNDAGDYLITLDGRPLKTPGGKQLVVSKEKPHVAVLVANEWENQETVLRPHSLPMTSLASRAVDGLSSAKERSAVVKSLTPYLDTDTICFSNSEPPPLARMQSQLWEPLLSWARVTYNVDIRTAHDVLVGQRQPEPTRAALVQVAEAYDAWRLAAFERAVLSAKSWLIGMALIEGEIGVETAADAARAEVMAQIEWWGEVEDTHDVDRHDMRSRLGSAINMANAARL